MKANDKSSGIAASVAQSRHHGELGISLAAYSDDLKNGANNFMLMLGKVLEIGENTVARIGDGDCRDYKAIAFEIETAIYANLLGSGKGTKEGFLRALADYLAIHNDGFGLPGCWDPLATTAKSFAQQGDEA